MQSIYKQYKKKVQFFLVYIKEAHPSDGWQVRGNEKEGIYERQPKNISDRKYLAQKCSVRLNLTLPVLVDDMKNSTNLAYGAWPDRIYMVNKKGKVSFKTAPGPRGFRPQKLKEFLKERFGK